MNTTTNDIKTIDQINDEWNRLETSAIEAIHDLFPHFHEESIDDVVKQLDPVLRDRLAAHAEIQMFELLLEDCEATGEPQEPWRALRAWVGRGCPR